WCDWKDSGEVLKERRKTFQFLYGAIGSLHLMPMLTIRGISIPIWCDWKAQKEYFRTRDKFISIPIWCDWKSNEKIMWKYFKYISIPIWCDWKCSISQCRRQYYLFQFLYGAIGRRKSYPNHQIRSS